MPQLADVPTLIEAGVPGFTSETWNGISAPPKTPAAIVDKLNQAIVEALNAPDVRAHLATLNMTPAAKTPAQAAEFIKADAQRWADVIRAAGVAAD